MDSRQRDAVDRYSQLAKLTKDSSLSVGRKEIDRGKDPAIWSDICDKLIFFPHCQVLDLGCGFGGITELCLQKAAEEGWRLTLFDIPAVIEAIEQTFDSDLLANVKLEKGVYPFQVPTKFFQKKFDRIILYSVLHYTTKPRGLISQLVNQLEENGNLLIGDIPNVNKKGRFLSSNFGHKFEANYRGVETSQVRKFCNQNEYVSFCTDQNLEINDDLVSWIFNQYRTQGYNVFVVPQRSSLPYSHTREDIVIQRL